jgi:RNA polymerase sigma-70 factor (ECF subfamily)
MDELSQVQRAGATTGPPPWVSMRGGMSSEPDPDDHAALIVAIALRRDRRAFAALFAHFAPRVKAYLRRLGTDQAIAEETAQEVLLAVWRKAPLYDPARASAAAWIFAIARNLRIDVLRRTRPTLQDPDPSDEPAPAPLADAVIEADERARRVRDALGGLPPEQLTMLQLAFFEERTHSQIEADLGVPLGTVKSRLRLAMSKLRAALKDEE